MGLLTLFSLLRFMLANFHKEETKPCHPLPEALSLSSEGELPPPGLSSRLPRRTAVQWLASSS